MLSDPAVGQAVTKQLVTIPSSEDGALDDSAGSASSPMRARVRLDELINEGRNTRLKNLITLTLAFANAADAVEVLAVGFMLTVYTNADGSQLTSGQKEILTGSIYVGMLIGGLVGGYLSDLMGRRSTLSYSLALNATAGLLSAFAPTFGLLSLFRVLAGIGIGASVPCLFTLGAELLPVSSRGLHLSYIASFWMVGSLYAALAAWLILGEDSEGQRISPHLNWRHFVGVAALPVFLTLALVVLVIPESPRYMLHKGHVREAAQSLYRLTGQRVSAEALQSECDELRGASEGRPKGLQRVWMLFQGSLRSTTVRLMLIWFTLCFGTYGLNTWISTIFRDIGIGNEFVPTFLFALANLPGNLASFVLIERLGRKRLLAYSMLLAALSAFFFALTSRKAPWVAVAASCAFQAFSVSGWNALDALSTESFPTVSRTTGMGILSGTGRFASLVAMVVNGTLERSIVLLFTVTGALTITGTVSSFLLPYEPTGMSLDGMTRGAPLYRELPPMV